MVSFFGLKFGDKKKKPDNKSSGGGQQQQQWRGIDRNPLGEDQLFGQHTKKATDASSIRSVRRPDTEHSNRNKSPYAYGTHDLAAASMFNLTNAPHGLNGSYSNLNLRPHASEANMRARFGANNGSSVTLAVPAPVFGSKYRANNGSSSSLALPGPGFSSRLAAKNGSSVSLALPGVADGSRPGTSSGRTKEWANPLDLHFARMTPSAPPTPRSPLGSAELQLPPTPKDESDSSSVFGAEVDDVVDSIIQAVKMGEKMADEKERERRKQQETAQLERERLERQRAAEARVAANPPPQSEALPRPQPGPQVDARPSRQKSPAVSPSVERPIFRGNIDERPGSRNGMVFSDTDDGPISRGGIQGSGSGNGPRIQGPQVPLPAGQAGRGPGSRPETRGKGSGDSSGSQSRGMQGPQGPARHGPPAHGPPTQGLPRIPRGHRRGPQVGPREGSDGRGPPQPRGPEPQGQSRPMGPGQDGPQPGGHNGSRQPGPRPPGPGLRGPSPRQDVQRSESPAPPKGPGLRINPHLGSRTQSPAPNHRRAQELIGHRSESPAPTSPALDPGQNSTRSYSPAFGPRQYSPAFGSGPYSPGDDDSRPQSPAPSNLGLDGPKRQESGSTAKTSFGDEPSLRDLMAPSPEPAASAGAASRSSDDGGLVEQFARPIIQSVQARRDTLTLNSPRRHSLSMEIEELEKSLVKAQQSQAQELRASMSSSHYSNDTENTEAALDLEPAPLQSSSPLTLPSAATGHQRDQSPMRGPLALRRGPRRPTLDEYGVPSKQLANSAYRRELRNGSTSPLSRSTTPQFHQPNRAPVTTSALDPPPPFRQNRQTPSTVIEPGFKFDFGPPAAPPTPDSTTWPLTSPVPTSIPADADPVLASEMATQAEAKSPRPNRADPPPPLSFNFSPDAYSRDPGMWTPPLRSSSKAAGGANDGRPSTSQGVHLAAAPLAFRPPSRARTPVDGAGADEAAVASGIGMARGPSVRHHLRRPAPELVDAFGTGFI